MFFIFQDFWATCACSENGVCPGILHCIEYIFLPFTGILSNFALSLKNIVYPEFVLNIQLLSFRILNNLRLPWKTVFALKIFPAFKYFLSFRIFEQLALALKNRVCPEFIVLNIYFLSFRILNNMHLAWISHCIEYTFCIQDFWATLRLPCKSECALNFSSRGAAAPSTPLHLRKMFRSRINKAAECNTTARINWLKPIPNAFTNLLLLGHAKICWQ